MKLIVDNVPKNPLECLFSIEPPSYMADSYPCKCKLLLEAYIYNYLTTWFYSRSDSCLLETTGHCPL